MRQGGDTIDDARVARATQGRSPWKASELERPAGLLTPTDEPSYPEGSGLFARGRACDDDATQTLQDLRILCNFLSTKSEMCDMHFDWRNLFAARRKRADDAERWLFETLAHNLPREPERRSDLLTYTPRNAFKRLDLQK